MAASATDIGVAPRDVVQRQLPWAPRSVNFAVADVEPGVLDAPEVARHQGGAHPTTRAVSRHLEHTDQWEDGDA